MDADTQPAKALEDEPNEYYELMTAAFNARKSVDDLLFYLKQPEPIRWGWKNSPSKVWDVKDAAEDIVKKAWAYERVYMDQKKAEVEGS